MSNENHELSREVGVTGPLEKRKKRNEDYSIGETIDQLSEREWRFLIDLYKCRCMSQGVVVDTYFLDRAEMYYDDYLIVDESGKAVLDEKNRKRAVFKTRRTITKFKQRGLVEANFSLPNELDLPSNKRGRVVGESWYYLSGRGMRIVEKRLEIPDESRLSKHEVDMERAKKKHYWELGKVYLDLRYNWMFKFPEYKQFFDWDWYPSEAVYSDNNTVTIRPDAIFKIGEQVFFIELDRSTEPVQRSPFAAAGQISIEKKLERYRDVIKLSSNSIIRSGIIAFIIPEAIYNARLENIKATSERVFGVKNRVLTGRNIGDIIAGLADLDG